MSFKEQLQQRSGASCEICQSTVENSVYRVPPSRIDSVDTSLIVCGPCKSQIEKESPMSIDHWRCLNDSIWSEHDAVKVVSWRMLQRLRNEGWPQDLLDMLYLSPDLESFARSSGDHLDENDLIIHRDSNGVQLESGDQVVLIKDLNVKGGGFTAKRGTVVKRISLIHDNEEQIEGKIDGQHIVILTKFVKKV